MTDALGKQSTYFLTNHLNSKRDGAILSQFNGIMHGTSVSYDNNGNASSRRDFAGNLTTYTFDLSRNLEIKRITDSLTTTTEWHPSYRIPARVSRPKQRTTYTYDDKGRLLVETVQATGDLTGASGFAATLTGLPRTWSYTRNDKGQVLTMTGPRTDVVDLTVNSYDAQGNLSTVTNAAGHVFTLSDYDSHGRVRRVQMPNGVITTLTYHPRGWLTSVTESNTGISESSFYDYYDTGLLKKVSRPGGVTINYVYDAAHRLTDIADSRGNTIRYTLDGAGNRLKEEVKDASGALSEQVTRTFNDFGRLQQITGGTQ